MRRIFYYICYWLLIVSPFHAWNSALAATDSAQAQFIPWSGWWWPKGAGGLTTGLDYRGHPAPIEKYELYTIGSYPGLATEFERNAHYEPGALSWAGQCDAYSAAAVHEHIDFYPSSMDNLVFYVGDKKGLLTACHQQDLTIRANSHDPSVFHYWVLHYIKENGVDFYGDLDGGNQVWNYPVYKYEMTTSQNNDNLLVTCKIWYVNDMVDPDFQGSDILTETYTYTLYTSGNEIHGGEWTGASIFNHPEQLDIPVIPGTDNPYLNYPAIRKIAGSKDDYLENTVPAAIGPGRYVMILLNQDDYLLTCDPGDRISLNFEKIDAFSDGIQFEITDAAGSRIYTNTVTTTADLAFVAESNAYHVIVDRADYHGGGVYRLDYDLGKAFEFAKPKTARGFGWGGFALINSGEGACGNVHIVGYNSSGRPLKTYIGPITLQPGEKRIIASSEFINRVIEKNEFIGLKVIASAPLTVLELTGYYGRNMASLSGADAGSRFVIPENAARMNYSKKIAWGIYNASTRAANPTLQLYKDSGEIAGQKQVEIKANGVVQYDNDNSPFTGSGTTDGWVMIEGAESDALKGYTECLLNGLEKYEMLGPVEPGSDFFIPHVVRTNEWDTKLVLINVSENQNTVALDLVSGGPLAAKQILLNPKEKKRLSVRDLFPEVGDADWNTAALLIQSSQEAAGYFLYETNGDDVYFPLMTAADARPEMVLPHIASDDYWWTGFILFNPFSEGISYRILPYDSNGAVIQNRIVEDRIDSNTKKVCTISELFGGPIDDIRYLKIVSSPGGEGLAGVFGIASRDYKMLSGNLLK